MNKRAIERIYRILNDVYKVHKVCFEGVNLLTYLNSYVNVRKLKLFLMASARGF